MKQSNKWNNLHGDYEEFYLLRYNAVYCVESKRHFGGACRLHLQGSRVIQIRSNTKWAARKSRFQRTTRRYIPEDRNLLFIYLTVFILFKKQLCSFVSTVGLQNVTSKHRYGTHIRNKLFKFSIRKVLNTSKTSVGLGPLFKWK
jgi:hypothetical protein